jgi:hypothetical protein
MVTESVAVAVFEAESSTCTPKVALPATGGAPVSTPPLDKLNPTAVNALDPEVTVQLYPLPEPPDAVSVSE